MFAQIKMSGALGDVSGIMSKVNGLMNIQEITQVVTNLQTNLAKMGVVSEMVEDAMGEVGDIDDTYVDDLINGIADKNKVVLPCKSNSRKPIILTMHWLD